MAKLNHFELITEAVSDDGKRVRLDGAIPISSQCPLCGRQPVEDNGDVRATIQITSGGVIRMVCQLPAGCAR